MLEELLFWTLCLTIH